MKKTTRIIVLIALVICSAATKAQNLQVYYDTGRGCVTSTIEMFRPDAYGSTFFFVDMDFDPKAIGAYTEIAREFCFWKESKWNWLSVHVEFDGGLSTAASSFNNSWLLASPIPDIPKTIRKPGQCPPCIKSYLAPKASAEESNPTTSNSQVYGA
jgi:hypothetical protein